MLESQVVAKIKVALKYLGGFTFKVHGGMFQMKGMPDILYWRDGKSYAFEVKLPDEKHSLSNIQYQLLKRLDKEGVIVGVVHSVDEVKEIISTGKGNLHTYGRDIAKYEVIQKFDDMFE